MANDPRRSDDEAGDRQEQRRRALEQKGFDPGKGPEGAEIPRGTDEHADRDPRGVDLDGELGASRREPGR